MATPWLRFMLWLAGVSERLNVSSVAVKVRVKSPTVPLIPRSVKVAVGEPSRPTDLVPVNSVKVFSPAASAVTVTGPTKSFTKFPETS